MKGVERGMKKAALRLPAWEPALWWTEPEVKKICQTCLHHDDHIGKYLCGDDAIFPPAEDDEGPCPAWEPRKETMK